MTRWHLAQVNIAVSQYKSGDPAFAGFEDNLDRINALAEKAPGFVWRFIEDEGESIGKTVFGDDQLIFNMSLWTTKEALTDYVYKSAHVEILRKRADWFIPQSRPVLALWWQMAGTLPTPLEARHRLERLAQAGPTIDAFTFRRFFAAPVEDTIADG